jgi:hypothetical protein
MNELSTVPITLIDVLNDGSRTRIGDPWRGSYHVAIDVTDRPDVHELREQLAALGVTHQVNVGVRDRIAIYDPASIKKLLELGEQLEPRIHKKLDELVRARGLIPDTIVNGIHWYLDEGKDPEWIAARMNTQRLVDGLGGTKWTADKVLQASRGETPRRLRNREATTNA